MTAASQLTSSLVVNEYSKDANVSN